MTSTGTRDLILDSAQALAQTLGFNGFSYADIAAELDIKKASIHYHFPSKQNLEAELLERYRAGFAAELRRIDSRANSNEDRLQRYAGLYEDTLAQNRVCLAGMMASDAGALPEQLAPAISHFFEEHIDWLTAVVRAGKDAGEFSKQGAAGDQASALLAAFQGGLMLASAMADPGVFNRLRTAAIKGLK